MSCSKRNVLPLVSILIWLSTNTRISAGSLAHQSTPTIDVFVYGFHGLSTWVLEGAESEAGRIFRLARIELKWINCTPEATVPVTCYSAQNPSELVVRFRAEALPPASRTALGMAVISPSGGGTAFVFYYRVLALQTSTSLLHAMLGRVLAHEITHLLLPGEEHSSSGLMRARWGQDDLRFASTANLLLDPQLIQLMQQDVRRKILAARDRMGK